MAKKQHSNGNHLAKKLLSQGHEPKDIMFEKHHSGGISRVFHLLSRQGEEEESAVSRLAGDGWGISEGNYTTEPFGEGMKFLRKLPKMPKSTAADKKEK